MLRPSNGSGTLLGAFFAVWRVGTGPGERNRHILGLIRSGGAQMPSKERLCKASVGRAINMTKQGRLRAVRGLGALMGALLLSACTQNVTVEGSLPTPKVRQLPVDVGVYYSETFKAFQHEERVPEDGTWKIAIGEQNVNFFRRLLPAMFDSVTEVDSPDSSGDRFDGLIVPKIVKYGFLTPTVSGLNFFSASIHYEITILGAGGEKVGAWTIVGYGKSEAGTLSSGGDAVMEATLLAIRDGGARIAIELVEQPQVAAWLGMGEEGETAN